MKEQSHKDEMSAAIRGDFERLRERGVAVTLAPRDENPEATGTDDAPQVVRPEEAEPVVAGPLEPEFEPESPVEPEFEPEPKPMVEPSAALADVTPNAERSGFLARLLGR